MSISLPSGLCGVDIGERTLRAAAVRSNGARHHLVAAAETQRTLNHPIPTQADVERLIRAMQRQSYEMRHVTIASPADQLFSAIVELPPRNSGAPVETLAKAELAKNVQGDLESYLWDLPQGRLTKACEYLAVGLSHTTANELIAPFERAGLTVDSIEPPSAALQRLTGANNRLVFDAGRRGVRIHAYEGTSTLFMRNYALTSETIESERMRANITGTIDYLIARFPALENASVVVLGDPVQADHLAAMLIEEYETTVAREMFLDLHAAPWLSDVYSSSEWAVAIGLAIQSPVQEAAA